MSRPLRAEEILDLPAGAIGVHSAAGVVGGQPRQSGYRRVVRLSLRDAEIRRDRSPRLKRHPRTRREPELPGRNDDIEEQVAGSAGLAAKSLAYLTAQTQPLPQPEVGED